MRRYLCRTFRSERYVTGAVWVMFSPGRSGSLAAPLAYIRGAEYNEGEIIMVGFIIERDIPNASGLSPEQLRDIARESCEAIARLGKPYKWHHSYVAGDKFYCVHEAESEEVVREHARCGRFPTDRITRITAMIEPMTAERIIVRS